MSLATEHAQVIADQKARDNYGVEFHELPASTQDTLFEQSREQLQNEIQMISESMGHG